MEGREEGGRGGEGREERREGRREGEVGRGGKGGGRERKGRGGKGREGRREGRRERGKERGEFLIQSIIYSRDNYRRLQYESSYNSWSTFTCTLGSDCGAFIGKWLGVTTDKDTAT